MLRLLVQPIAVVHRAGAFARGFGRRHVTGAIIAAALLWGAGDGRPRVAAAAPHRPKPWFDAKGVFVFPLAREALPSTREQLAESLTKGWKLHLRFPEGGDIIQADGGWYPAMGSLHMRLSNGIVDTHRDMKADPSLRPTGKVEGRLAVRDFDLEANPLVIDKAKINFHITAVDARLDLQHDEHGRPMIMLADAKNGTFQFQASNEDLERVIVTDLNEVGEKYKVKVTKAALKLTAVNDRSIDVDLHVSTKVLQWVPANLRFQAHVDIDSDIYAKLSNLKCEGDEALGQLIEKVIRPGLNKYEGKSRLVFGFPTGELKLIDVKIQGGDDVRVTASFTR